MNNIESAYFRLAMFLMGLSAFFSGVVFVIPFTIIDSAYRLMIFCIVNLVWWLFFGKKFLKMIGVKE